MSTIANLTSASSALPLVNIHPHGHKKGSQAATAGDSGSTTAAQVPVGTAQNLFSTMLQSLEQVIGVQLGATAPAAASYLQANGSQTPKAAGSNVSVTA